jgi:energy-coupling factor transporter transmembrane protein EcfT
MRTYLLRANPLTLMSIGIGSLLGSLAIRSLDVALVAVAAYAVAALVFLPSWRYPLACLAFTALAGGMVVYSTWRGGGHDEREAVTAGLRILVLAWPGSVALGYADQSRLADYLAQSLHLPARLVAALSVAFQRFAGLHAAWQQLDRVRRARGFGPSRNPLTSGAYVAGMSFALLVDAMRGATRSAVAMDARGFAAAHHRTWAEPATWSRLDVAGLALAAVLGAVPVVAHLLGG